MAGGALRKFAREFFLLILEFVEAHFDQFTMPEGFIQCLNELRAQTGLAHFDAGRQTLGRCAETPKFRVGQTIRGHGGCWLLVARCGRATDA
jgi:hypothetical protein